MGTGWSSGSRSRRSMARASLAPVLVRFAPARPPGASADVDRRPPATVFDDSDACASSASQKKANILFIMGDDIGWMQPSIYHRGLMVGETPNIDRIGNEGAIFMDYVAMQSCTSGRNAFFTGMYPLRTGMIPPQLPGSPSYLRPDTGACCLPPRPRLHHGAVRQEPSGRPHRGFADSAGLAEVPGCLATSPARGGNRPTPGVGIPSLSRPFL
jgi:hypothetical protein